MNKIYKKHSTVVKKRNNIKTTRGLFKARRKIKKQLSDTNSIDRTQMIARMKLINEYIKEEENDQYKRKINKVVEKLKSKRGINGANTWELMNQLRGRKEEKATSIWAKNGEVLEKKEDIIARHKEYFEELLQTKEAKTVEEKETEINVRGMC